MKQIIIDADTGVSDSLATLCALRSLNFRMGGITMCFGNDNAERSADNCLCLIQLLGYGYEVPVVVGSNESLNGVFDSAPAHIHGDNEIGNVELLKSSQKPMDETIWSLIIRRVGELKDELTVITTGRTTDLARALEEDPGLPSKVKKVVTMGGILKEPGNANPYAEVNIHGDTKAANRVFRAGLNLVLVELDATMKTFITNRNVKDLCTYCQEEYRATTGCIRDVLEFYFEFHRVSMDIAEACVVHDSLAIFAAEDPSLGVSRTVRVGVGYEHEPFRGMIKTDTGFVLVLNREEITMCMKVDSERAARRLPSLFQGIVPGRYSKKQRR